MFKNTLTDILIERGIVNPMPGLLILDKDTSSSECFVLDGEQKPKNEEKDRE